MEGLEMREKSGLEEPKEDGCDWGWRAGGL